MNELLRQLPSITDILAQAEIQDLLRNIRQDTVVAAARDVLDSIRRDILADNDSTPTSLEAITQSTIAALQLYQARSFRLLSGPRQVVGCRVFQLRFLIGSLILS